MIYFCDFNKYITCNSTCYRHLHASIAVAISQEKKKKKRKKNCFLYTCRNGLTYKPIYKYRETAIPFAYLLTNGQRD